MVGFSNGPSSEPKFCCLFNLQRGVFLSTLVSWILWFGATVSYLPYCLYLAPRKYAINGETYSDYMDVSHHLQDWQTIDDVMVLPDDDYYWGKIFITVVMFGLLVDSLGLAAVYVQYKVKSDLLIPMLAFYSLLVPATLAGTVRAAITIRRGDEAGREEEFSHMAEAIAFPIMAIFYSFHWINTFRLARYKRRLGDAVIGALTQTFLEPLAAKAKLEV